jgi:predicted dehydrogenase
MIKVGVCGLGMMGSTHLDIYQNHDDVQIVAVADANPSRLSGESKAAGNIDGQAQGGFDLSKVEQYSDAADLIANADVDVVDICLPTSLHQKFALQAIAAKKHVLVEKPLCRSAAEAKVLVEAAEAADTVVMSAMCMRFWPGWDWLAESVGSRRFGAVLGATFRRVVSHPGGEFYLDGKQCGGALLDLHIHDTDFINHCFGMPKAVTSSGYSQITGAVDHVMTQYHYDDIPLVAAEGGWCMSDGFAFSMRYNVNFENATASYDLDRDDALMLFEKGQEPRAIPLVDGMGYDHEIAFFLDCIRTGSKPELSALRTAAEALVIYEAELKSTEENSRVSIQAD